MKLIVSSDKMNVVNASNISYFYVGIISNPDYFVVRADEIDLSYHENMEKAKKELNRLVSVISCQDSFLYQSENSQ